MPGALKPTVVVDAWVAADFAKVFPANSMGGAKYLKSLKSPTPADQTDTDRQRFSGNRSGFYKSRSKRRPGWGRPSGPIVNS